MVQEDLQRFVVVNDDTVMTALKVIDTGTGGVALVVGKDGILEGVVTDGDIRRTLIGGRSLEASISEIVNTTFTSLPPSCSRNEALDLMRARGIQQIPIVDECGKLVGLHLLQDVISPTNLKNRAVIMVGGKGMRLRPITEHIPKPMVRVAGRPILERIILHLVGEGIRHIILSVNYKSEIIEKHFGDGSNFGCRIDYLLEDKPLGSGGSLSLVPEQEHPILVMNGDLLTDFKVGKMLDFHESGKYFATIGIRPYQHSVPFGCITLRDDVVVEIREKPIIQETINAGIYVISPEMVAQVPPQFFPITDLFKRSLCQGEKIGAYLCGGDWSDIGEPLSLKQARGEL